MRASILEPAPPAVLESVSCRKTVRVDAWIVGAALLALAIKLAIAWNTFGTNDVASFYRFAQSIDRQGLELTYRNTIAFNHPPLVAYFLELIYKLSQRPWFENHGLGFPFLLRLPAIMADLGLVLLLLRMRKKNSHLRIPNWILILFALSPVSVMVSGFHGNTDSLMVFFLVLAAYTCTRNKPILCGFFLSLSYQVKIIPLLLFPIFFFYWHYRHELLRFLVPLIASSCILWSEPLFKFPAIFGRNVLSYDSFWGLWGITYLLRITNWPAFRHAMYFNLTTAEIIVSTSLKLFIIACVLFLAWRRRALPEYAVINSIAYTWIIFFVFSPGVCAQYMVWLAPFILLLSPMLCGWLVATSSLFVFFFYNTISDSFPWYMAISLHRNSQWVPWSLLPWVVLIASMILLWRNAVRTDHSLRLFSFETLSPTSRN